MLRAAVIGAGVMGCGVSSTMISHASGYARHPNIDLVGILDNNLEKMEKASSNWNCQGFSDLSALMLKAKPDLVSICVPDVYHPTILEELIKYQPKLVILEKPTTLEPELTLRLLNSYNIAQIPVLVNYSRRYLPHYYELKERCLSEGVIAATIKYAKGIKHNGCHAIDLGRLLFGEVLTMKVLESNYDYSKNDPTLTAHLTFEHCKNFILQGLDERYYTHFEVDIFTRSGRYIIDQDHKRLQKYNRNLKVEHPESYKLDHSISELIPHDDALVNLFTHAVEVIQQQKPLICGILEAWKSESISNQLFVESLNSKLGCLV